MSGAIFSLAVRLLVAPADLETAGDAASPTPSAEPVRTSSATGEALPAPPPPTAAPPPGPAPAPAPAPVQRTPTRADANGKPPPKWWGPFPRPRITGFGGPIAHLTGLPGAAGTARQFALFVGLAGGMTIRGRVSIGATAMWLLNPIDAGAAAVGAKQRLNLNYGGALLDIVLARKDRVDVSLAGVIGGGGACLQDPEKGTCYAKTAFFLGQPGLAVHVRLLPVLRLGFGLGWRFIVARDWTGPSGGRLGAPVGSFMLELGWF